MSFFFFVLYVCLTLSFMSSCTSVKTKDISETPFWVGLYNNGVHLSYLFPIRSCVNWFSSIDKNSFHSQNPSYLLFGWGDLNFYQNTPTWDDFSILSGMEALFYSNGSAVHVTAKWGEFQGEDYFKLRLTKSECETLSNHILSTFLSTNKLKKPDYPGYSKNDHFYHSDLHYSIFRTCNTWVSNGFEKIGFPTPMWSGLSGPVFNRLKKFQRKESKELLRE